MVCGSGWSIGCDSGQGGGGGVEQWGRGRCSGLW